ncbi:hypothetical protein CC80DRAFT_551507 [Byssothecium circinans]|uniref:Uncharacterized protein n=1 Tax=Byssothecium circinans TaxID=147558 RepID=A0A6A5TL67_9PLEO|nr:hypothetical protein CC80DRAFT_551507 [Byssothecium circinans]
MNRISFLAPVRAQGRAPPRLAFFRKYASKTSPAGAEAESTTAVPGQFNKTGEKESSDAQRIRVRSDEYSKSGGDDVVAEQEEAAFAQNAKDTDPSSQKALAGKGNMVNPLEVSPATPEVSRVMEEKVVEKNVEREPGVKSGKGVTKKAKVVKTVEIDFDKIKMRGR